MRPFEGLIARFDGALPRRQPQVRWLAAGIALTLAGTAALAQAPQAAPCREDYATALGLQQRYSQLALHLPDHPAWLKHSHRFVYRRTVATADSVAGGHEFMLVDADRGTRQSAFDHAALARVLSQAMRRPVEPYRLPFDHVDLDADGSALRFVEHNRRWRCQLQPTVSCQMVQQLQPGDEDFDDSLAPYNYDPTPPLQAGIEHGKTSPDGRWRAYVEGYDLVLASSDGKQQRRLSQDGSEDNYYAAGSIAWSPDSRRLAAYRIRPGFQRKVYYIESSPADQRQPRLLSEVYPKPGDPLPTYQPVLFAADGAPPQTLDPALFPNPFALGDLQWRPDSRTLTFEYNQRGHQLYRVIEADAASGRTRTLIEETASTFIDYDELGADQFASGKHYRHDLRQGHETLWGSERDGWEQLYLYDNRSGRLEHAVTHGPWVVRAVDRVDEKRRQVYFRASGMTPGEDPYYLHTYRIGLDGRGLTALTPEPSNHATVAYSDDGTLMLDLYSRYDQPPVLVLRRAGDGATLMTVEQTDIGALVAAGWRPPIPFHAKGRDGKTEIWGLIHPPLHTQPGQRYRVVEDIYAGPQGSFVPKSFSTRPEPLTALGFAVAQIDGMGTNNRSRAFHDVAWHNLKDAGFADRIAWHQAAARAYPWYDIAGGVGIFGTSAGGQSAMGALLFHPEFYTVAVANSGSHDNRMDKLWWNEQWMGWPVGPWYGESSNVDNAWRLRGKLMLVVGETDHNVDPSTTFQVVDRLTRAHKDFSLLYVPGGDHGAGGAYGERRLLDFFVNGLQGRATPDWNAQDTPPPDLPAESSSAASS